MAYKLRPRRCGLQVVAQEVWPASGGPGGVAYKLRPRRCGLQVVAQEV